MILVALSVAITMLTTVGIFIVLVLIQLPTNAWGEFSGKTVAEKLLNDGSSAFHKVRYEGDQVFRFTTERQDEIDLLNNFVKEHSEDVKFWKQSAKIGQPIDIHIKREAVNWFQEVIQNYRLKYTILVPDVQELIDSTEAINRELQAKTGDNTSVVGHFVGHDAINAWLDSVCKAHPDLATCGLGGITYGNRQIRFIRLGSGKKNATKNNILIVGGIHAREWLAPATLIHIINRFVTTYKSDNMAKRMLDLYNWYIMPVINPDGYEYSRYGDRLWRKTRSVQQNSTCIGVDGNRNFDFHWGSSDGPCSDTYPGPQAFSEVEAMSISDFTKVQKIKKLLAFFSIHTYSQLWMLPYGYARGARPSDYKELLRVGQIGTKALEAVNNQDWRCGNIVDELYVAAGNSVDWFENAGAKYSFVLELRGDSFIVPETQIDPSGHEVYAGLTAAVDAMKKIDD